MARLIIGGALVPELGDAPGDPGVAKPVRSVMLMFPASDALWNCVLASGRAGAAPGEVAEALAPSAPCGPDVLPCIWPSRLELDEDVRLGAVQIVICLPLLGQTPGLHTRSRPVPLPWQDRAAGKPAAFFSTQLTELEQSRAMLAVVWLAGLGRQVAGDVAVELGVGDLQA